MADFPGSLYTKTVVTDNVTSVLAAHHNDQDDEILAIETELGTDVAGSKTDLKTRLAVALADDGTLEFADSTVLTISSGAVTVTQNFHRIATEGGAGSDYLATINGLANDGAILLIRPSTSNDIILDHGADNIVCTTGADITLADTNEFGLLFYDSNLSAWVAGRMIAGGDVATVAGAANSYVAVYTGANEIEGTDDLQWDGTTLTIGDGTAGRDYELSFNGEDNDIIIRWMEDEALLDFDALVRFDGARMYGTSNLEFYDTAVFISSENDGHLDLTADVSIDLNGAVIATNNLSGTPDEITATSEGVAASVATLNTEVTTNGDQDLDNVTLAVGTSGQIKNIYCVVEGHANDTWKITPAAMVGGTIITFTGVGQGCTLVYANNEGWVVVGNNGGTIS